MPTIKYLENQEVIGEVLHSDAKKALDMVLEWAQTHSLMRKIL